MSRRALALVALAALALATALAWWSPWRSRPRGAEAIRAAIGAAQPNIVVVTIDTLRVDRIGAYGSDRVRTPQIDRLAREGVRFANAATTVPFTLPAHSSIMTGTYPPYHGVRENVGYALDDAAPTLAELLADAGYHTAGFVSAFVLDAQWGIGRGFAQYHDDFDVASMQSRNIGSVQRDGADTLASVAEWLDRRPEGPFFLWVHLFDPHDPYTPPEPYASEYPDRPYDGEVAYTDSLVGKLRTQLERRGLLEESLLVLTGDHGEGLGDHGEVYHGYFIYESTAHVPLVIRAPGAAAGRVVETAVSHVDLLPTILDVAGIPIVETAQGSSLAPLLVEGRPTDDDRAVYTESYYALSHYGWAPLRSLRTARYKYIAAPREELYEIPVDPGELRNVAGQRAATAFELAGSLQRLAAEVEFEGERSAATPDIDEDSLRQLRALGYIAGRGAVDVSEEEGTERVDPKDGIEVHQAIMAAQSEIGAGNEPAAESLLLQVLARDPDVIDANQMVGNIKAQRGDHAAAIPFFQKALEIDPEHEASLFGLATAYRRLGRNEEALVGFRRLLEINPTDSKTVLATADMLVERGALAEAGELMRRTVESGESVPPMLYDKYGEILVLEGRPGKAEEWFRRAAEANDELAQPLFNLGVLREEEGRIPEAVELYEQTLERSPEHFQALFNLGRLYGRMGDIDRQVELYEAALAANPDFVRGYLLLAKLLMDTGRDLGRAEELAREGIARDPDHESGPLGWYVLADILNRQGRRSEAQEAVGRGREIERGGAQPGSGANASVGDRGQAVLQRAHEPRVEGVHTGLRRVVGAGPGAP